MPITLFSARSERQFCERLGYDMLFKCILDMNIADPGFDHVVHYGEQPDGSE